MRNEYRLPNAESAKVSQRAQKQCRNFWFLFGVFCEISAPSALGCPFPHLES